jgi:hypothetical protein
LAKPRLERHWKLKQELVLCIMCDGSSWNMTWMQQCLSRECSQGRINSLRGPRPVFSAGPQSTEKCGGVWVCVRRFIIYVMRSAFVNYTYSFYHRPRLKIYKFVSK